MTESSANTLAALSGVAPGPCSLNIYKRLLCVAILFVAIFPLWYKLGSHPLYPRSEGRYASVSKDMLINNHWIVPKLHGKTHLTKPPLIYWAQAGCMKIMGFNEWACRVPSAVAGTLVLIIIFSLGWYLYDLRLGALATGVLGAMPLFVIVSRLTLTDSLLNLFWFAAMVTGFLAVLEPPGKKRNIFIIALWLAVAFGWMTKGPLALVPVGVLWIWLALAGRWADIKIIKPAIGLILSALPIALWALLVGYYDNKAWHLWYMQMIGRAISSSEHPRPIWYFIPIFLGGMFPATIMLYIPGVNYSWRRIWPLLKSGGARVYWGLQIIFPFIMFSLIHGKLATYILPLCAPLALLTGFMLLEWLDGKHDNPKAAARPGVKPPEVVGAFFVALFFTVVIICSLLVYALGSVSILGLSLVTLLLIAAGWMWNIWKRKPQLRSIGLAIVFFVYVLNLAAAGDLEQNILIPHSTKTLIKKVEKKVNFKPKIVAYGYEDRVLDFYYSNSQQIKDNQMLENDLNISGKKLIVIARASNWKKLKKTNPELAAKFTLLFKWRRGLLTKDRLVLEGI